MSNDPLEVDYEAAWAKMIAIGGKNQWSTISCFFTYVLFLYVCM